MQATRTQCPPSSNFLPEHRQPAWICGRARLRRFNSPRSSPSLCVTCTHVIIAVQRGWTDIVLDQTDLARKRKASRKEVKIRLNGSTGRQRACPASGIRRQLEVFHPLPDFPPSPFLCKSINSRHVSALCTVLTPLFPNQPSLSLSPRQVCAKFQLNTRRGKEGGRIDRGKGEERRKESNPSPRSGSRRQSAWLPTHARERRSIWPGLGWLWRRRW